MDYNVSNLPTEQDKLAFIGWFLFAGTLILFAAVSKNGLFLLLALFAAFIGGVLELWHRLGPRGVSIKQQTLPGRVTIGEDFALEIAVENRKRLPMPWIEVTCEISVDIPLLKQTAQSSYKAGKMDLISAFSLWSMERIRRKFMFHATKRGYFIYGPVTVRMSDPFGWKVREIRLLRSANAGVIIYPKVMDVELFNLPARSPLGELKPYRRFLEDPLKVTGVREYIIGDDPRRIHWKNTARAGALRSKIYDSSNDIDLLIALNVTTNPQIAMGYDENLLELAITFAASISEWALEQKHSVGLLANCLLQSIQHVISEDTLLMDEPLTELTDTRLTYVPIGRDSVQGERILSALARLLAIWGSSMHLRLENIQKELPIGATILYVGAIRALNDDIVEQLFAMQRAGMGVILALTGEPDEEIQIYTGSIPIYHIGGTELWNIINGKPDEK